MTRRLTITIICDECGRLSHHEQLSSGFQEQLFTSRPFPKDWSSVIREHGGSLSPVLDFCPTCNQKQKGKIP